MNRLLESARSIGGDVGVRVAIVEVRLSLLGRFVCLTEPISRNVPDRELQLSQDVRLPDLLENEIRGQVGSPRLLPLSG